MKSNDKLGGLVQDVTFDNICIRNSPTAISIGTHSGSDGHHEVDATGHNKPPQYTAIHLSNILIQGSGIGIGPGSISPGSINIDGLDAAHRLSITLHNVVAQPAPTRTPALHADIHLDATNFTFSGDDLTLTGSPSTPIPNQCDDRFVPFPAQVSAE
jgi:polygalacturonase